MLAQCLLVAAGYPGVLYLSQTKRERDHPVVIRFRLAIISLYTLLVLGLYFWKYPDVAAQFGLKFDFWTTVKVLAVTSIPFIPSLLVESPEQLEALTATRNLIVGPLTEELIYRGVICGVYKAQGASNLRIILQTPLFFGIAHLHHGYELVKEGMPVKRAAVVCLVQFAITLVFGMYAAFIWVRTGSVWPALAAHTFCNWMGPPTAGPNGASLPVL